ncbi:hypothetical protein ACJX0J_019126, partial [Zea mays]
SIPSSVLNLTGLTILSATENYMTGRIPDWLGNLTDLTDLNLAWNNFSGQIPQALDFSDGDRAIIRSQLETYIHHVRRHS